MSQETNQEAIEVMLSGIYSMCQQLLKNTTLVYDGIVVSDIADSSGKWQIKYNGKTHSVKPYGSIIPSKGKMVKVFLPQGNQALSFFI